MRRKLMKASVMLGLFVLACISITFGQSRVFIGKITDSAGSPIKGASILIQGTNAGSFSGEDGVFQIKVNGSPLLLISAINYATEKFNVGSLDNGNIVLRNAPSELGEVVVTALGIRRNRNSLPYSAQQISGDELSKTAANSNPISTLSGKVAGLQITQQNTMGGSTNVILRGVKSLTQSNQALFVVDGVPYDNTNNSRAGYDLGNPSSDINPEDIASISVLKGPAASALYGSRASNGVIMITTKKGTHGLNVALTLGGNYGIIDNSTLPTYQKQYGGGYTDFYSVPTSFSGGSDVNVVMTDADASTGPAYDGSNVYQWDAFIPGGKNYGKATPWSYKSGSTIQNFLQHPINTTVGVSVNGASDKGYYKMNYINDYGRGMVPNSTLKKNLLTFGASYALLPNVKVSGQIDYSNNTGHNRNAYTYAAGSIMTDARQWWQTNVSYEDLKDAYNYSGHRNATWNWNTDAYLNNTSLGDMELPAYHNNPYWAINNNFEADNRDRYFGHVQLDWQINKDLSFMSRVSRDYYTQTSELGFNQLGVDVSSYDRNLSTYSEMNYDFLLNYNKQLSNDIGLKALLGANVRRQNYYSIYATTDGGLIVPSLWALSNSVNTPAAATESQYTREIDGVFAGATIDYRSLLTLDATLRRDQSSTLPKANNSFYYPSVSLNFQFGKLLKEWNWLTNAKVWANYAIVGGDAPVYSLKNTYTAATAFNSENLYYNLSTYNNPDLKPEKTKSAEIGLEANFLHNRLGFTAAYYDARTVDQIMPSNVSSATGFTQFYVNGGTIQNKGLEVSITATPVRTENFSWDVNVNWSKNIQVVKSLYGGAKQYVVQTYQNSVRLAAVPGKSYQIQGTDYKYVNGQKEVDDDGYYVLNDSSSYMNLGSPFNKWIGGIRNNFTYKSFTFGFLIDVRKGGSVYSLDMDYGSYSGLYPRTAGYNAKGVAVRTPIAQGGGIILDGVHADGSKNTTYIDESDVNGSTGGYTFSSAMGEAHKEFVYDAGYIKLREVSLSYNFPKSIYAKWKVVQGMSFAVTGRNLWIIHKNVPYSDPEQGQASGNGSMGFQNGAYPNVREIGAQLNIKF